MSDKNYSIVDGKIVPRENGQFEYGERWIMCEWCHCNRPAAKMSVFKEVYYWDGELMDTHEYAVCKDDDLCVMPKR